MTSLFTMRESALNFDLKQFVNNNRSTANKHVFNSVKY